MVTELLRQAIDRRAPLLARLHAEDTDCYRLLHGAVEGAPGVAVDRYGPVLLVQTWRAPLDEPVEALAAVVSERLGVDLVPVWNHRAARHADFDRWHPVAPFAAEGRELGLRYDVSPRHRGDDPLLFLDFRVGRRRVREAAAGRSVLNLFAYTCGIGVAAAAGGAAEVLNVDFAASALEVGRDNARRNGVGGFETLQEDVIPVIRQLAGLPVGGRGRPRYRRVAQRRWDVVVLDPVRWAKGRFGAVDVVRDYPSLFKPVVLLAAEGGHVLATNHVASVALEDWLDVLRRTAAKAGRPIRSIEVLRPEDDFPSPDGRPPLKLAWIGL